MIVIRQKIQIKKHKAIFGFFLIAFILVSCNEKREKLDEKEFRKVYGESLIKQNKKLVKEDEEIIRSYIRRKNWNMELTGTGLFYEIYKKTSGAKADTGKLATINYKISLLDGTVCYTSTTLGSKTFKISQGGVEAGLEEGILLMKEGEKARFIMAPYLAYGLIGDGNKIPARAIIVYEVELIKIEEKSVQSKK
jgi:FKBP-type peptidyl-prolyl cis-trans isomerase